MIQPTRFIVLLYPLLSVEGITHIVEKGVSGSFIELSNPDNSTAYLLGISGLSLLKQKSEPSPVAPIATQPTDEDEIAESISRTLRGLSMAVKSQGGQANVLFHYDRDQVMSLAARSSNITDPNQHALFTHEARRERMEREGRELYEQLRSRPKARLRQGAGSQIFKGICSNAIDWLEGSMPRNSFDHIRPIPSSGECPSNHFLCAHSVHHAHFNRHFHLGIVHFHWHEAFRGVITHLVRDLHCHRAIQFVEVDTLMTLQGWDDTDTELNWGWFDDGEPPPGKTKQQGILSNDPMVKRQYSLQQVNAAPAWAAAAGIRDPPEPVKILVIDSGVDTSHPDLKANFYPLIGSSPSVSVISADPSEIDTLGHGTHCSGIIGARVNNNVGIAGVSNNKVRVSMCKFLSDGTGQMSDATKCIDVGIHEKFDIISASWGGTTRMQSMTLALEALARANILFVVAAGNDGANLNQNRNFWPACERNKNQITVGATDQTKAVAEYSNYGDACVDVFAPGSKIVSTIPPQTYGSKSGTSMATPLVAGLAGLAKSVTPALSADQLADILRVSRIKDSNMQGKARSGGRLDANMAVNTAISTTFFALNRQSSAEGVASANITMTPGQYITLPAGGSAIVALFPSAVELMARPPNTAVKYHLKADLTCAPLAGSTPRLEETFKYSVRLQVAV